MSRFVLSVCCAALLAACHHGEESAVQTPVSVKVAVVSKRTVQETLQAAGTLTPPPGADVKLGSLVAGRLAQVLVADGDRVKEGQVLARIEATPFKDALAQAEAQLAQARAQKENDGRKLERAQKLLAAGIAARQEVDDAQAQAATSAAAMQVAGAAVSTARNQFARTELKAPFDGLVAHVSAAAGEPVDGSGKPIVEVAKTETLELHAVVPVGDTAKLFAGQKAEVVVSGAQKRWDGQVIAVSPLLDATTGTASVRVRIENPDRSLKGGEVAEARIVIGARQDVLAIPLEALVPAEQRGGAVQGGAGESAAGELAVETVDPQGKALRTPVTVGVRGEGYAEISSGLQEGQRVIVQGAYALPDGTPVRVEGPAS
jgi:RND family efflux transporter MFP subunit